MKKFFKTLVLLMVIASMVLSLFACGEKAKTGGDGDKVKVDETNVLAGIDANKYKGKTITFSFSFMATDEEAAKAAKDVQQADKFSKDGRKVFEDATGCTIINRPVPAGEDYVKKITTEVSAGMGPDIVNFWPSQKPSWMIKNILRPLSDYIDFNKAIYQDNTYISQDVKKFYTWAGKVYAVNGVQLGARLYYNKEKFETAGLEDPLELWKQGKWDWQAFFDAGVALTQDSNGDGTMDQWGYASWFFDLGFITSNNVNYVTYDETGLPRFALDDKFVKSKQAGEDMINKYKMCPAVWWDPNPQERLWNGETVMDYWGYWEMPGMTEHMKEKLGIVPFPRGPDLPADKKNRDAAETIGFGITATSQNPELAALYLEWTRLLSPEEMEQTEAEKIKMYGSKELYDLAVEWAANSEQMDTSGFGQGFADALGKVTGKPGDKSWQQAIEENRQACQAALDDAIVNMK